MTKHDYVDDPPTPTDPLSPKRNRLPSWFTLRLSLDVVPIIATCLWFVVHVTRLDSRVEQNTRDIDRVEIRLDRNLESIGKRQDTSEQRITANEKDIRENKVLLSQYEQKLNRFNDAFTK